MPAPDFPTLYDFESQIEAMYKAVFETALAGLTPPITAEVGTSRAIATKPSPRYEITFQVGAAGAQMTTAGQAGPTKKQVPVSFGGQLVCVVVTSRAIADDNGELHGKLRGLARYLLSAGAQVATSSNLPYLQILTMLPTGSSPQIYDEKEQDKTVLAYDITFAIQNTAWPAS